MLNIMQQEMEEQHEQKALGDDAFREGRYEEAFARYSAALEDDDEHVPTLCNRSLAALKLGRAVDALDDAEAALDVLSRAQEPLPPGQLAKAVHRKAEALLALGELLEAVQAYRQGLAACKGSPELHAALRLAAEQLPVGWLAKYFVRHVEAAEAPNPISARDGRLIKPVPPELRLPRQELQCHLEAALHPLQDEARDLLCEAWAQGRRPSRADTCFLRGAAYLAAGNAKQALKDARFALAYGPQLEGCWQLPDPAADDKQGKGGKNRGTSGPLVATAGSGNDAAPTPIAERLPQGAASGRTSAWPAALALQSAALEALADNVLAALSMARAAELDPDREEYSAALERLMRRIPQEHAAALQSGGAAALEGQLAGEKEAGKPEFLKKRPKYYYYFEWMKRRIRERYPELPEPVMDKLLSLEANELDMVLQYPRATQLTVERLMDVYQREGPEKLETYAVPLLSWEDYQAIREDGGSTLALPAGASAAAAGVGRLLEGSGAANTAAGGGAGVSKDSAAGGGSAVTSMAAADGKRVLATDVAAYPGSTQDDATSETGSLDIDELCGLD